MIKLFSIALTASLFGYGAAWLPASLPNCPSAYDSSVTYQDSPESRVSETLCDQTFNACNPAIFRCVVAADCNTDGPVDLNAPYNSQSGWAWIEFCQQQGPTTPPTSSPTPLPPTPKPTAHHAGGCHPPYSAGANYAAGQQVSATATTETYNYQCVDSNYCSNPAYGPTGLYGGLAWVKGAQCSGIITPALPNCPSAYDSSATYQDSPPSRVSYQWCTAPSGFPPTPVCYPAIHLCHDASNCNMVAPFPWSAQSGWTLVEECQEPHAGGCHPPYSAGLDYAAGQQVSATATTETPTTTTCTCSDASCPNNPGQTTGCTKTTTVTTSETYNYQCVDSSNPNWHYCKNPGFEPAGPHGGVAWVKGAQCSGIITPLDPLAGIANPPGCPEDFVAGTEYEPDAKVSTSIAGYSGPAKQIYICAADPMNQFCGQEHYEPGMGQHWNLVWTEGTVCIGSVSPTASPSWDAARMIDGCPGAWAKGTNIYEPGDRVSKNGIVFECSSGEWSAHCSSEGYEPDVDSETDYWKMVWTLVGRCTGTIAPTGSPTFDQATVTGCPDDWVKGTTYEEGDLAAVTVSSTPLRKIAYKCKTWPFSGHCSMYSPAESGGDLGWTKVGGCTGTISPTAAPSFDALALVGGCPDKYSTTAEYEAGDRVAFQAAAGTAGSMALAAGWRFIVYECKGWPSSSYCSQDAYKPGSQYDDMAWTVKGHCDGTLSPTAAPTAYANLDCPISAYSECTYEAGLPTPATTIPQCKYNKEVQVTGVACNCGDSGCPTPSPTSTTCTKTVTRNSCPAVNNWSSGVSYVEGDVVRVAANMYTCKGWPFDFNCNTAAYKPTTDPGGLWEQSWTASGTCPSSC